MGDPLLTIGAFARAVGLTTSALRHYDECGLLHPAEVDDVTGYRYYTPNLAGRARLVAQMREAGMSIAAMRTVLDGPPEEGQAVLHRFVEEQTTRSARSAAVLEDVLSGIAPSLGRAEATRVDVRGPELAAALRQARAAADSDAKSPLASVLIDVIAGSLDVVATNRYWMAVRTLPVETPVDETRVILSQATAMQLAAHLDAHDRVTLTIAEDRLTVGSEVFASRPVSYPAHRLVMAGLEPVVTRAVLSRIELVDAIEAARRAEVTIALTSAGARLGDDPHGRNIPATVSGSSMRLRLGSALTLRALAATLGPEIELEVSAPDRPVRVTSPYQRGFVALVMPLGEA